MSKTMFIDYLDEGFWARDVAVGVFLKHVIDRACLRPPSAWLSECIERWRVSAVIPDVGMHLDPEWSDSQRQIVRDLMEEACQELQKVEEFSADEAASIELGRAVSLLLEGALPAAPAGSWWFYGVASGVTTIQKNVA